MPARQPELEGKIFKDEKGIPYEDQRFIMVPSETAPTGFIWTEICYLHGKLHGDPAIVYPDGLEETWDNGKFVKVRSPPYHLC